MLGQQQSSTLNNISNNYPMPITPFITEQQNIEEDKKHTTRAWVT